MKSESLFSLKQKIIILGLVIVVIIFQFVDFSKIGYVKDIEMIKNTVTRLVAGLIAIYVMITMGHADLVKWRFSKRTFFIMIPALVVAVNNFPIIAFLNDRASIDEPLYRVILFFVECLSVGFFEELLFRGLILIYLVQQFSHKKYGLWIGILISSLIFGLFHLVNLLEGASFGPTMLQVGYSFLMGMLWSVTYLKTGNLWLVMVLHALYNFFGQVMFYLGNVNNRFDTVTTMITILFALGAALHAAFIIYDKKVIQFKRILGENNEI